MSTCNNQLIVDLAAIKANIESIRNKLGKRIRIMVMVKALAYGINDVYMTRFFASCGIDIFGVSSVEEGIALRKAGVNQAIFLLNSSLEEVSEVVAHDFELAISDFSLIEVFEKEAHKQKKKIKVHLHVDTGMIRFGSRPEEVLVLAQTIQKCSSLKIEGLMTHFSSADDPKEDEFTLNQINCFQEQLVQLKKNHIEIPWLHAANSSAVLRFQLPQFNMVRIGLAVYGIYPSEASKACCTLQPSLSLISRIVGINTCKKGDTVSYGRSYTVIQEQAKIAVLPLGYFDGIHRHYSGKGEVLIAGKKAPMVGKICMDYLMVDITQIPYAKIGDPVLIFGTDNQGNYLSAETLAMQGNSIVHELITCLGPRIQRVFINRGNDEKNR